MADSKPTHKKSEKTWQTYADLFGKSIGCFAIFKLIKDPLHASECRYWVPTLNWPPSDFENVAEQGPFATKAWEGESVQILCGPA